MFPDRVFHYHLFPCHFFFFFNYYLSHSFYFMCLQTPSHFSSIGMLRQVGLVITISTPSPLSTIPSAHPAPSSLSSPLRPQFVPSPLSPPLSSPLPSKHTPCSPSPLSPPSALPALRTQHRCIPSPLWASGFSFSDSSLLVEAPYDPRLSFLFFGEETSMAAR